MDVLFDELSGSTGTIGLVTLNRPKVLNALNYNMIKALHQQLTNWRDNDVIRAVIIRGKGERAFCAGGDIRSLYEQVKFNYWNPNDFFADEYALNLLISEYPKPYLTLLDGITMGGGAGVSIHGSHRIATKNLKFAMPETGIGFFPDVGASYFLSHCPGKLGLYLGLTGNIIGPADSIYAGFADIMIEADTQDELISQLQIADWTSTNANEVVNQILEKFAQAVQASQLVEQQDAIDACFAKATVADIIATLEQHGSKWAEQTLAVLATRSPTSLLVTFTQLHKGAQMTLADCLKMEYHMATCFAKEHDFFEGVRAMLIDKDKQPKWQPDNLEAISVSDIEKYFI